MLLSFLCLHDMFMHVVFVLVQREFFIFNKIYKCQQSGLENITQVLEILPIEGA